MVFFIRTNNKHSQSFGCIAFNAVSIEHRDRELRSYFRLTCVHIFASVVCLATRQPYRYTFIRVYFEGNQPEPGRRSTAVIQSNTTRQSKTKKGVTRRSSDQRGGRTLRAPAPDQRISLSRNPGATELRRPQGENEHSGDSALLPISDDTCSLPYIATYSTEEDATNIHIHIRGLHAYRQTCSTPHKQTNMLHVCTGPY